MKIIVGLGNPGEKYLSTRHNLGFMVVDEILKSIQPVNKTFWEPEPKFKAQTTQFTWQPQIPGREGEKVLLVKHQTYMNLSGQPISVIMQYYKVLSEDIWLIYDELDLPFGSLKIRFGGGSGGHHGVDSVLSAIGTDKFWRYRLGIGHAKTSSSIGNDQEGEPLPLGRREIHDAADYVLDTFKPTDQSTLRSLLKRCSDAVQTALEKGIESAQNQFNTK